MNALVNLSHVHLQVIDHTKHLEDKHFKKILENHNIKLLGRYVDDIINIFGNINTNKEHILTDLNKNNNI